MCDGFCDDRKVVVSRVRAAGDQASRAALTPPVPGRHPRFPFRVSAITLDLYPVLVARVLRGRLVPCAGIARSPRHSVAATPGITISFRDRVI